MSTLCISSIQAESKQPNVLILYADDMGFGDLAIQNSNSKIPTPYLDKLAGEGMRFTNGHSSSGICTPSRYALLTGRYHWRDFHDIVKSLGESVFKDEQLTMPEMFQGKGYHTACIGKWHLGWDWSSIRKPASEIPSKPANSKEVKPAKKKSKGALYSHFDWSKPIKNGPLAHGFDHYFGDNVINFPPYCWIVDDKVEKAPDTQMDTALWKPLKEGGWECRPGPMVTGWDPYEVLPELTRRAVTYIEGRKEAAEPFFLYFAFPSPHAPIVPTEEFEGKSEAGPYGDFVYQTDWSCGQLLKALESAGLSENTIVIFTADNGAEKFANKRLETYKHWSSAPFRGLKRDVIEGGHRVPFLVKWPENIKPGSVSDALFSQTDIMATLASAISADIPEGEAMDSYDLLPVWKGEVESVRTDMVHNTWEYEFGIREGDWVFIDNRKSKKPSLQLYNLSEDIEQKKNLAKSHPEKVKVMQSLLEKRRQQESQ